MAEVRNFSRNLETASKLIIIIIYDFYAVYLQLYTWNKTCF
jgi:hypothetical protein